MAKTNHDFVSQTAGIVGAILAAISIALFYAAGASGMGILIPAGIAFLIGFCIIARFCPSCGQMIFRGSKRCSECTEELST